MADEDLQEQIAAQNKRKLEEHLKKLKAHGGKPPPEEPKPRPQKPASGNIPPRMAPGMDQFRKDWESWKKMYGGRVIDLTKQPVEDLSADYKLLGVPQTATKEEIRKAFYKLAKTNHPDQGGDPDKFRAMMEAYSRLSKDSNGEK